MTNIRNIYFLKRYIVAYLVDVNVYGCVIIRTGILSPYIELVGGKLILQISLNLNLVSEGLCADCAFIRHCGADFGEVA